MSKSRPGTSSKAPPAAERILIVRPSALGDVCRSVPVLASLRRAYPAARIDWIVQDSFAPAIAHHPALTSVIAFPRNEFGRMARRMRYGPILRWMSELRRRHYDLVLDCQGLARSAIFTWATRAPRRIGYANAPEAAWLAYTTLSRADMDMHAVDRMLSLVSAAGVDPVRDMRLYPDPDEASALEGQIGPEPFIIIAPTSRWPGKRWPQQRFIDAARAMLDAGVRRVVVVGAPSERDQCSGLIELARSDPRIIDRVGATTVGGLLALVSRSTAVLCNDSAVLHMAVGLEKPLVALYGPTRVNRVGPYRRDADVIQHVRESDRLDHKDDAAGTALMERITVAEVVEAVLRRYRSVV
ncbi:MAG: hypothetical protein AMXMBFR58_10880 [Phycisphaerae bacterium]